jgi:predicted RecB family nuclease
MQLHDGRILCSPSDLHRFVECDHLSRLMVLACRGELDTPRIENPSRDLLRRKGLEHERARLDRLREQGREIHEIESPSTSPTSWAAAAQTTECAMRRGVDVIYQGVFADGAWRGVADFLVRVAITTRFGNWGYEAWDTKLARHSQPNYILQLAFYSEQIRRLQGVLPAQMHVVLGTEDTEAFSATDFDAYFRFLKGRLESFVEQPPPTSAYPVSHCSVCDFSARCEAEWERGDHLSRVARIRRDQVSQFQAAGIQTMAALGASRTPPQTRINGTTVCSLIAQARLQSGARVTGQHSYELIPLERERGFALLPPPNAGDLFFDIEGYPYFEPTRGLEYLFGVTSGEGGEPRYRAFRAHDRPSERRMFEQFIDHVRESVARHPGMHVYHYASYEPAALKRLMQELGTREEELDDLLRRQVLVDLYRVVRQTLRISHDGYSLKQVRTFFMPEAGQGEVAGGEASMVAFERWLQTGNASILDAIQQYNEEDCLSTLKLRDWLLERKAEAERAFRCQIPWRPAPDEAAEPLVVPVDPHRALRARLARALSGERAVEQLLSNLLDYHRREAKPAWWEYFDRLDASEEELLQNAEAIAGLVAISSIPAVADKRSLVHTLSFPDQEYKLTVDIDVDDPRTGSSAGRIVALENVGRTLQLKRGRTMSGRPLPAAIVSGRPVPTDVQEKAITRLAEDIANSGFEETRFKACADILLRRAPRFRSGRTGDLQTLDLREQAALVGDLDGSYLFVQGPPGSGKTYTGARLIVSLLADGHRIGVAAPSHKAIHNLLDEIEAVASARGSCFVGLKKSAKDRGESIYSGQFIQNSASNPECESGRAQLVAGTSWLFAREGMELGRDYLFIDEAGQVSLADALAMGTAVRNVVLLGDPQQLPHVARGVHPAGSGVSVLEHLLGDAATVAADRGLFLARTWRLHPDVCRFVSALSYEGRLESAAECVRQTVTSAGLTGTGLRYIPVVHEGNTQQSAEEAAATAAEIHTLLASGTVTDASGCERALTSADILVVAPYNMQVRCLKEALPAGVEVGTVDRFQGREAAVVFFSMATSSGNEIPRNLEFLFSRNRLNVAVSRARCLAVLVASPRLLEARCRTVDQMRLVNGLCRFVEMADQRQSRRGLSRAAAE